MRERGDVAAEMPALPVERATAIRAALSLLDDKGFAHCSRAEVAHRLGAPAAALRDSFPDRDALHRALAEAMVEAVTVPEIPPVDWRGWLRARAERSRRAMLSRRDGPLLFARVAARGQAGALGTDCVPVLCEAGFGLADARLTVNLVDRFTIGAALHEQSGADDSPGDFTAQLGLVLAGIEVARGEASAPTVTAERLPFQSALWRLLRNTRDSANIAFARAEHINELDRRILLLLQGKGDMTLAAISTANGVDKAQVSRAIKRLSQVGLILRGGIRSPLRLSVAGRALTDKLLRLAELRNRELTFGIPDDQLVDMFAVLEMLLARAMVLYDRERRAAFAAGTLRTERARPAGAAREGEEEDEEDPEDEVQMPQRPEGAIPVDRSRIMPPFITLCAYFMRAGALAYKRETLLSNFETWVLAEVSKDPPISWPQLVLAVLRDQSQAGRTIKRLMEAGLVERTGRPGRRHGFFAPTIEGTRINNRIKEVGGGHVTHLFEGIDPAKLANFLAAFDIISRNAEVQLARERAMQEMDRE